MLQLHTRRPVRLGDSAYTCIHSFRFVDVETSLVAEKSFTFDKLNGKNLFVCHEPLRHSFAHFLALLRRPVHSIRVNRYQVGVPGAFTGACSAQVPGYIKKYQEFTERGIKDIYIVGVNDVFVMKYVFLDTWSLYAPK